MNIKSLLLGSAAALVAVSGARAADAVSGRRAGADGICPRLRYLRRWLLLHPGHRDLPARRRLHPLRHRRGSAGLSDVIDKEDFVERRPRHQRYLLQARSFRSAGRCPFGNRARHSAWLCTDQLQLRLPTHPRIDIDGDGVATTRKAAASPALTPAPASTTLTSNSAASASVRPTRCSRPSPTMPAA